MKAYKEYEWVWTSFSHGIIFKLSGRHFDGDDDVTAAVDHLLKVQDIDFYNAGVRLLHAGWTERVNAGGDCVEK